jgi:hypothetical protein
LGENPPRNRKFSTNREVFRFREGFFSSLLVDRVAVAQHKGRVGLFNDRLRYQARALQLNGDGVPAKVHVIEPTGSETQVMGEFAGATTGAAFRERVSARPGETMCICSMPHRATA